MFKGTEVEKKKKKRNKYTYWYADKSLFVQIFKPLFIAVSPVIAIGLIRN